MERDVVDDNADSAIDANADDDDDILHLVAS